MSHPNFSNNFWSLDSELSNFVRHGPNFSWLTDEASSTLVVNLITSSEPTATLCASCNMTNSIAVNLG